MQHHLDRALRAIEDEQPLLAQEMAKLVHEATIDVQTPEARFTIQRVGPRIATRAASASKPSMYARTTPGVLLAILDGHQGLEQALLADQIHLRGDLEHLLRLDQALQLFIQAAVRSPSILPILQDFRQSVEETQ